MTTRVLQTYRRAPESKSTTLPSELTTREREVLTLIARGLTNSEIAEALGISATTVKSHIGRIFVKLDLRDRPAVIVYAYENGIVTADHRSNQI